MKRTDDLITLYWRYWPIFAGLLISFYILWVLFTPESFGGGFFPAILVFTLRAAATYAAVKSVPAILPERQRRSWRYFSVGLWIWLLAGTLEIIAWGIRGAPWSEPSVTDLLRLAGYLAMLTGCAAYPMAQHGRFGRIREALEVSILGISVLSLSWLIYLSPSISARTFQIPSLLWLTISPILDLILTVLGIRLTLLQEHRHERLAFGLFSLSFIVLFISDMSSSYNLAISRASIPSMTQAGWMATATLVGLAFQWMTEPAPVEFEKQSEGRFSRWIWRLEPLVPVAFTYTVVGYLFFDWWFSETLDWVALTGAAGLIILLFARQGVIAGQREMSQFAALVTSTSDMAFIVNEQGKLILANPALLRAMGQEDELLGNWSLDQFLLLGEGADLLQVLETAVEAGWSGEGELSQPDGKTSPIVLTLNPVIPAQRGLRLLAGTAHDLTPIRQREDDLRSALKEVDQAREELSELNVALEDKVTERTRELGETVENLEKLNKELKELDKLKSEFVALVSHELRAPMTNIRSGIELLLDRYPDIDRAPKNSLALIQAEVHRLTSFVETILDLSALEAGRFPIELGPVQVAEVLELALARFSADRQARVELVLPDEPISAQGDGAALESIFYHLLDNAFKYAPEGKIWVEVGNLEAQLQVHVRDTGPGIPHAQRQRIFEMFHRLDARDSREVYGYGLGLPMVQRLLAAMGGRIEVADTRTQGTEIVFWLPSTINMEQTQITPPV